MKNTLLCQHFIKFLLALSVVTQASVFAQVRISWEETIGASGEDVLADMQQTADGGFILGGTSNSPVGGDKSRGSFGDQDYWVVKRSADGTKEWDKTFGGSYNDYLTSIQQTPDGGYILGGISYSLVSGNKTAVNKGGFDYWIIKLDAKGNKVWDKTYGGINDEGNKIIVRLTPDGGYIIGGSSASNKGGDKSENGHLGNYDLWIVKITSTGEIEWDRTLGTGEEDGLNSLNPASDGGYLLGGREGFNLEKNKYVIRKLAADGTLLWEDRIGPDNGSALISEFQQTPDGGYILGGTSTATAGGDQTEDAITGDFWIVKLDAARKIEWNKVIGTPRLPRVPNGILGYKEELTSLLQTEDGGYLLGGAAASNAREDKSESTRGWNDYWIVMIDAKGKVVWDKTIGGPDEDHLEIMRKTSDGGYLLGGYSNTYQGVDPLPSVDAGSEKSDSTSGNSGFWIVKIDVTQAPLSVTLENLTGKKQKETAVLTWQTTSETRSDRFEVEHSLNGKTLKWNVLATVKAKGESQQLVNYQYVHATPDIGENLYRLKIYDEDGNFAYSRIKILNFERGEIIIAPVSIQWEETIGASDEERLEDMQQTADGGYILGGTSTSPKGGDKSQGSRGSGDYWIVKLSADGTKEWDKTFGGSDWDELTSIQQTSDGGYILGGVSRSPASGDKSSDSRGSNDYWIVKLDAKGVKEWDRTYGGSDYDNLKKIRQTPDGGYIIGGTSYSNKSGEKSENNLGELGGYSEAPDFWIIKIKANGNIEWDRTLGSSGNEYMTCLSFASDSTYLLGGRRSWSDGARGEYVIMKLAANGTLLWQDEIGPDNNIAYLKDF
jgi:hypothetical protein